MAKISAHGATKTAELTSDVTNGVPSTGGIVRYIHVLRSDGAILRSSSFPQHPHGSVNRKRSTYRKVAQVSVSATEPQRVFEAYHARFVRAVTR